MPVSLSDKPNDNKPATAPATAPAASADDVKPGPSEKAPQTEVGYVDINDSRLNNQTNCYGVGPDSKKSAAAEVAEKRAERVKSINDSSADVLTAAAASGSADVHNLLGQRQIAELNGDEDELKRIDQELADGQQQTSK